MSASNENDYYTNYYISINTIMPQTVVHKTHSPNWPLLHLSVFSHRHSMSISASPYVEISYQEDEDSDSLLLHTHMQQSIFKKVSST